MKLQKLALIAAIACGITGGVANAGDVQLTSCLGGCTDGCDTSCDCGEPVCGCEAIGGCDTNCCDGGCDSAGCGCIGGGCLGGDCCLGDPYKLFDNDGPYDIGGWVSLGYHSNAVPLFNNRPDELNLHQAWLYAERAIDTSCGFDIGGRIDYVYGIDAQDTQAFGIANDHWDNDWDNGAYGHALPQAYLEAGYGDLSVKVGHFYTIIGWEVVGAPGNFFYSHAYTFFNSEPFTHTGALATYNVNDDVTAYGGYVLGWDSGFEDNGDAFLGGLSVNLTDELNVTYATIGGRFNTGDFGRGAGFDQGRQGYMHSIVANYQMSDTLQYIFQSDLLEADDLNGNDFQESIGINQYLIRTINDCNAVGARFEWYQSEGIFNNAIGAGSSDIYALTLGWNHRPNANLILRPEVRWDFDDDQVSDVLDGDDQFTFGVDGIVTF